MVNAISQNSCACTQSLRLYSYFTPGNYNNSINGKSENHQHNGYDDACDTRPDKVHS